MNEPEPLQQVPIKVEELTDWQINFVQKIKDFGGGLFMFLFLLCTAGFMIFGAFYKIINRDGLGTFTFFFLAGVDIFLCFVLKPWSPATIEKKGALIKTRIKGGNSGISDIKKVIHLSKLKSWYYSDETHILGFEVPSIDPYLPTSKQWKGTTWEKISLKGIKPEDLAFLLKWLAHDYKRSDSMDEY